MNPDEMVSLFLIFSRPSKFLFAINLVSMDKALRTLGVNLEDTILIVASSVQLGSSTRERNAGRPMDLY